MNLNTRCAELAAKDPRAVRRGDCLADCAARKDVARAPPSVATCSVKADSRACVLYSYLRLAHRQLICICYTGRWHVCAAYTYPADASRGSTS